jgi:hypothetical protein
MTRWELSRNIGWVTYESMNSRSLVDLVRKHTSRVDLLLHTVFARGLASIDIEKVQTG